MDTAKKLALGIENGQSPVGIIGLGYVGLPLAGALHSAGLRVLGFDVDQSKIDDLEEGRSYMKHLDPELFSSLSESDRFSATTDFERLAEADIIIVCVPTPLGSHQEPDLSYVIETAKSVGRTLRAGQLIILESTTYPGTTRDDFLPAMLEAAGHPEDLQNGRDFFVAYSPEREDPGRKSHSTSSIVKLVGGLDDTATSLAVAIYEKAIDRVIPVSSAEVAEAAKLLENIFRAVNIALVNELKVIFGEMGINVWEVVEAAATKPFGFMPFYPGPGLGGHCIPIDPFFLSWKAKEVGRPTRFIELAGTVNTEMPNYVISRVIGALNEAGKAVQGSRVLILGLAYKPDVDDTRESPSFIFIERLSELGAHVDYSDPHIAATKPKRKHDLKMQSVELTPESLASYDVVIVATDHKGFDYALIAAHANLVVDTRNAMARFGKEMKGRLVLA